MKDTFGQRFRECRERAGLTQDQIAAVCKNKDGQEVSRSAISGWENDKDRPTYENLFQAASRMGASVDYMMGLSRSPEKSVLKIDFNHLKDCIEVVENYIPTSRYAISPEDMAKIIVRLYQEIPPDAKLPSAEVLKLIRPVKDKYYDEGDSNGRKLKARVRSSHRRRDT